MPDIGATPGHAKQGEVVAMDARIRWAEVPTGGEVTGHFHCKGHFTIVCGDITVSMEGQTYRLINDWLYIPANVVHSLRANSPSKYFCCGDREFDGEGC